METAELKLEDKGYKQIRKELEGYGRKLIVEYMNTTTRTTIFKSPIHSFVPGHSKPTGRIKTINK